MRKSNLKILFALIPSVALSSCGYSLKEVYRGDEYNSPVFEENFYRVWDERIKEGSKQITSETSRDLKEGDFIFDSYKDPVLNNLDKDTKTLSYTTDFIGYHDENLVGEGYGPTKCLSRSDDSFKYGYISKLFNGQIFCGGKYQLSRVQIDESGFGVIFDKECNKLDYFAMNFKASSDYTQEERVLPTTSILDLKISFYCKNEKGFDKKTYVYKNLEVGSNRSEVDLYNAYTFAGFKIDKEVTRLKGISVEYDLISDENVDVRGLDHSLMLYEIFLPNSNWR